MLGWSVLALMQGCTLSLRVKDFKWVSEGTGFGTVGHTNWWAHPLDNLPPLVRRNNFAFAICDTILPRNQS